MCVQTSLLASAGIYTYVAHTKDFVCAQSNTLHACVPYYAANSLLLQQQQLLTFIHLTIRFGIGVIVQDFNLKYVLHDRFLIGKIFQWYNICNLQIKIHENHKVPLNPLQCFIITVLNLNLVKLCCTLFWYVVHSVTAKHSSRNTKWSAAPT